MGLIVGSESILDVSGLLWMTVLATFLWPFSNTQEAAAFQCGNSSVEFRFSASFPIQLNRPDSGLCTLVKLHDGPDDDQYTTIPVARSYDGFEWERAGGMFAQTLSGWNCDQQLCISFIPAGRYQIQAFESPVYEEKAIIARFLESASFGTTRADLKNWNFTTFGGYIRAQMRLPPSFHREFFRKHANPTWKFHKPEFSTTLDACASNGYWTRYAVNKLDRGKRLVVEKRPDGGWTLYADGYIRSMPRQFQFVNPRISMTPGVYVLCGGHDDFDRKVFKIRKVNQTGACFAVKPNDFLIDFPDTGNVTEPDAVLVGTLPSLDDNGSWEQLSAHEYMLKSGAPDSQCSGLPIPEPRTRTPIEVFAKTISGPWLMYLPRMQMDENSLDSPLFDGGLAKLEANETWYCSNVKRSFLNEASCRVSSIEACAAGGNDKDPQVTSGVLLCGSPGEVANDPSMGDSWLDVACISNFRSKQTGLPVDKTTGVIFEKQREYIWSSLVLTSKDQLRQRLAWALFQIFALPPSSLRVPQFHTEDIVSYYDIFVRNAFGNYRDILREVTYNPLMAESLSFVNSKSLGASFRKNSQLIFPDENYARELMQLFTIGLVKLNLDGTPVMSDGGTTNRTYDSDAIMSFAAAWTGFTYEIKRGNVEAIGTNRLDPMRILPASRDRFPKTNLQGGYIGDLYPLCSDLPPKPFLRSGAKYRLLGTIPEPELVTDERSLIRSKTAKRLELQENGASGLYRELCSPSGEGECSFPPIIILDHDLLCPSESTAIECIVETVRVVKVGRMYFEFEPIPCVNLAFFQNGVMVSQWIGQNITNVCTDPSLAVARVACCSSEGVTDVSARNGAGAFASSECHYAGERTTFIGAQQRCMSRGGLCQFPSVLPANGCTNFGYRWTDQPCSVRIKVNNEGEVAITHNVPNPEAMVQENSPNFFRVYWVDGKSPSSSTGGSCGQISCTQQDDVCLCDVSVLETVVFFAPPTGGAAEIVEKLNLVLPYFRGLDQRFSTRLVATEMEDYTIHSPDGSCCNDETVFEVLDDKGGLRYYRNIESTVWVSGEYKFRNPPQFNSLIPTEYTVLSAQQETEAVLDHLFHHPNTPPFVAYQIIQRFGVSNPSPSYIRSVAAAFQQGVYEKDGETFGKGVRGDLAATVAAVLLDPEARSVTLDADSSHGALREPILKVIGFMRAMEFKSTAPLVELDMMNQKVGQGPYAQQSVFSYFRPEFTPSGAASTSMLVAPEAQVMSSGRVVALLNGLFSLVAKGLVKCREGFGSYGCNVPHDGSLLYQVTSSNWSQVMGELSLLLTSSRLREDKQQVILQSIGEQNDPVNVTDIAMQLVATTPEFHSTSLDALSEKRKQKSHTKLNPRKEETGYKAVIHLALRGGCDSFNMLAPYPSCDLYEEYTAIRDTIALSRNELLEVTEDTGRQPCNRFGVHHRLPLLQELYGDGDLCFVNNVGVLSKPVAIANYQTDTVTQLFAHNAMQVRNGMTTFRVSSKVTSNPPKLEVDRLDPFNSAIGTGTLGRMADVLFEQGYAVGRTSVESGSLNLASSSSSPLPVFSLDENGVTPLDVDLSSPAAREVILTLNDGTSGVYGEVWSSILKQSLNQTETVYYLLQKTTDLETNFSNTPLSKRAKLIAQLIKTRQDRNVNRDFFFVTAGGYDTHNGVVEALEARFGELNEALESLVSELKILGVWENVTIVQTSDFGRTLTPNSNDGSDHGWGGHYFVAGGSVRGNRMLGEYPSQLGTGDIHIGRGRMIPTTSWDSIFNSVAQWMGVMSTDMNRVLPNRPKFKNLFQITDLFE